MSIEQRPPSTDSLATRAKVAVVVPATNTVVQPEMEAMRPAGVTNHVTRMRLPPRPYDDQEAYKQALRTEKGELEEALELVLLCEPHVVAHGHSIHSFRGDGEQALAEERRLEKLSGIPFVTPSRAVLAGLEAVGRPKRIAVLTPYWPPADEMIAAFSLPAATRWSTPTGSSPPDRPRWRALALSRSCRALTRWTIRGPKPWCMSAPTYRCQH